MLYRRGAKTEVINIIWREKKSGKIWFSFHHAFEDSVIPGGTVRTPSSLGIFYYTAQTMAKKALLNRVKHFAFRAVKSPSGHLLLALGSSPAAGHAHTAPTAAPAPLHLHGSGRTGSCKNCQTTHLVTFRKVSCKIKMLSLYYLTSSLVHRSAVPSANTNFHFH